MSSFLTLSLHVIPNSLLWNLWWAASNFFICVTVAMILHHTAGLRYVTHKAWFSRRGWYSCFSRCLPVSRLHLLPFQFLSCIPCHSFLLSTSSCPGNKSRRPLQHLSLQPIKYCMSNVEYVWSPVCLKSSDIFVNGNWNWNWNRDNFVNGNERGNGNV